MDRKDYTIRTGGILNENRTGNVGDWVEITLTSTPDGKKYFGAATNAIAALEEAVAKAEEDNPEAAFEIYVHSVVIEGEDGTGDCYVYLDDEPCCISLALKSSVEKQICEHFGCSGEELRSYELDL